GSGRIESKSRVQKGRATIDASEATGSPIAPEENLCYLKRIERGSVRPHHMCAVLSAVERGVLNSSAEDSELYMTCVGDPSSGQLIKFGKGSIPGVEITRCEVEI